MKQKIKKRRLRLTKVKFAAVINSAEKVPKFLHLLRLLRLQREGKFNHGVGVVGCLATKLNVRIHKKFAMGEICPSVVVFIGGDSCSIWQNFATLAKF